MNNTGSANHGGSGVGLAGSAEPSFYKWKDENGVTHFSSTPPSGGGFEEIPMQSPSVVPARGALPGSKKNPSAPPWNPRITIRVPKKVASGLIVPLFVSFDKVPEEDPLTKLTIAISSNPPEHRKLVVAHFNRFLGGLEVSTRARISGDNGIIEVTATSRSGQARKRVFNCQIDQGADFSRMAGAGRSKGKARVETGIKPDGRIEIDIRATHPMVPRGPGRKGSYIDHVDIDYRNERIAEMDWGDAVSRNPFFRLKFLDWKKGRGETRITLRDSDGKMYQVKN